MTKKQLKVVKRPRCILAQFCDDIRYEVGNKVTLVGLYNGTLFLQEFPALIPRFGINLLVDSPLEEPVSTVVVRVEKGDEIILQTAFDVPRQANQENLQIGHDQPTRRTFAMQMTLPPITITSPCMLRVMVVLDGVECVAGKLRIAATPITQASTPS